MREAKDNHFDTPPLAYASERVPDGGDAMMVFAGNANRALAERIVNYLNLPLGKAIIGRFSDGEVMVEIIDSVRGKDVFIVQPTCRPANENLMELLVMADAMSRASAARVTAVIPYYGYARQDRRPRSARVADLREGRRQHDPIGRGQPRAHHGPARRPDPGLLQHPGGQRLCLAHTSGGYLEAQVPEFDGGLARRRRCGPCPGPGEAPGRCGSRHHRQTAPAPNEAQVMNIIGDVTDRTCVIVDDMADTAGTLCQAAGALKQSGAQRVVAYCTHPVLSGPAVDNVENSELDELVVTDTIPLSARAQACTRIRQLSIAELLAESIRRVSGEESVGSLFMD